jgi:curli biogenesis system outer membrane secretion channel CsgG
MALGFVAGYRDASQKYEEMRQAAILRMAMMPFEDKTGTRRKYGSVSEVIMDDVISAILRDNSATEFLELISRERLEEVIEEQALSQSGIIDESMAVEVGKILGVTEILSGKITQIIVSPSETTRDVRREKSKVVIRHEKYVDDEGKEKVRKIYGEVEAKVIIFKRSTSARIRGSYNIVDVMTARILKSDSFEESSTSNVKWATFSGDERAISWNTRQLSKKGEQRVPVEGEMVNMAARKISTSLTKSIKDYAR